MAGIAEALFGKENPFAQWANSNSARLGALGAGLASGTSLGGSFANAAMMMPQARMIDDERAYKAAESQKAEKQLSETIQFLRASAPDLAALVEAGMPPQDAWAEAMRRQQPPSSPEMTASQRDYLFAQENPGFSDFLGKGSGEAEFGVNPIYGRLDDGTMGIGVIGKDGTLKRIDTEGFQPLGPYDTNALKAAGTAYGKGTGQAQFDVPSAELTMQETLGAIEDIRSNKAGMDEQFGNILGLPQQLTPAWPGSPKANFRNSVARGADQAFLQAREMLRGGGQITDFEGRKAENAITNMTLASESGDKAAFERALADFEAAVKAGYVKLIQQAGTMPTFGNGSQPMAPQGGGAQPQVTTSGVQWSVGP